jgi:hypothetical protein
MTQICAMDAHHSVHLFCPQTCLVHLCNHPTGSGVHLAKSRHGFTCSSCAMIHGKCWKVYSMHFRDSMHLALQVEALAILGIVEDKARRCVFACHPWGTSSKVYMAPSGWTEQLNPTLSQWFSLPRVDWSMEISNASWLFLPCLCLTCFTPHSGQTRWMEVSDGLRGKLSACAALAISSFASLTLCGMHSARPRENTPNSTQESGRWNWHGSDLTSISFPILQFQSEKSDSNSQVFAYLHSSSRIILLFRAMEVNCTSSQVMVEGCWGCRNRKGNPALQFRQLWFFATCQEMRTSGYDMLRL